MQSPFRNLTVRTRLSLLLAGAIAGAVFVLAAATARLVRHDMQTAVFALQGALIDSAADDIEQKLRVRIDALVAAATTFKPSHFQEEATLRANLHDRAALASLFDNLSVTDIEGNGLTLLAQRLPSIADRPHFQQVLATDRPVVSEPIVSRATGRPTVVIAVPIHDDRSQMIGVLSGAIELDRKNFLGSVGKARVGHTGYYFIVTDGAAPTVIAHRIASRVMKRIDRAKSPVMDLALGGFRGTVQSVNLDGLEAVFSFRSITSAPWIIGAVYPTEEAYAAVNRRVVHIAVGATLLALVAMLVLRWSLRRELAPLDRLRANMEDAADGRDIEVDEAGAATDLRLLMRLHNESKCLRSEAQAAQREGERRLRDITDHIPALIAVFDAEGRYLFANAHFDLLLGLQPASLVGRRIEDVRGAAYFSQVEARMQAALGGENVSFETHLTVEGDPRCFQETYVPRRGVDGAVIGVYAVTSDITDQHRDRARLGIAERRLRSVTDHLPAIVLYVDSDERYGFVNRRAQEVLGGDERVVGERVQDIRGDTRYLEIRPWIARALRGETVEFENGLVVEGLERIFRYHYVPEVIDGVVCGFFGLIFDVTELRASEARVRVSEHRLQSITDNVPVLISYIDPSRRLSFVNRRLRDWFGKDPVAAVGQRLGSVMGDAFAVAGERYLDRAFSGARAEFEVGVDSETGLRQLHTVYVPDTAPDGRTQGIFALTSDVTAARAGEQQLRLLARVDTLTGMANRRAFDERLEEAMARCRRSRRPMGLIFLDVDHFKQINDSLGHAGGDAVLKTFAARIAGCIRETDLAARLAGDEFVIVLESLNHRAEAALVSGKVLAAIRQPMTVLGQSVSVTSSLGVAYYDGTGPATPAELIARADRALYRGKEAGRDTFAVTTI